MPPSLTNPSTPPAVHRPPAVSEAFGPSARAGAPVLFDAVSLPLTARGHSPIGTATPTHGPSAGRSVLARSRLLRARAALADCRLCAHHCGVNRLAGEHGLCRAGSDARVFLNQVEVSDEVELVPTFAIAFSGCDLRCAFCISGAESWNSRAGEVIDPGFVANQAIRALEQGARTVMVLGGEPTVHLPSVLEIVAALPDDARLAWKTNGHGSAQARALLAGLFDVWVLDYKFGNEACAERLAGAANYPRVVQENLVWMAGQSQTIVRHLLMPGHVDCCWRAVATWLAGNLPDVKVNLRSGFWPAWQATRHPELRRTVSAAERDLAFALASELGLNLVP